SLGAVVYEMLTGEPPHTGPTSQAIIAKVLTDKPRSVRRARDTVPEHVEVALEGALAKLPADRFSTAHEFADALVGKPATIHRGVTTPASTKSARGIRVRVRRNAAALTATGVALIMTAVALWAFNGWKREG